MSPTGERNLSYVHWRIHGTFYAKAQLIIYSARSYSFAEYLERL